MNEQIEKHLQAIYDTAQLEKDLAETLDNVALRDKMNKIITNVIELTSAINIELLNAELKGHREATAFAVKVIEGHE